MKNFWLVLTILLLGTGCGRDLKSANKEPPEWFKLRKGIAIITEAKTESGSSIKFSDGGTGRFLTSILPPTFADNNGTYTTNKENELVKVQLSVTGSPEGDRILFEKQAGLTNFEDGKIVGWNVTAAYQESKSRWIIRATQPDPFQKKSLYHVIECLGDEKTNNIFWNGCRTIIESSRFGTYQK